MVAPSSDIDELLHVSNIAYVRWIQEVAKAHSAAVGLDHAEYVRLGAVFVVRRHDIEYLAPAYAGDAILLTTWIAKWGAATSERRTRITREGDGRELVRATTVWAFISMETLRPKRIPPELGEAFARAPG
jgi:acyl-CoA thioester hydrolase